MLKNYFRVALRNFWRNKVFSAINILGLAIGISSALVIYLIVQYDLSFDKFHKDGDRIYRVVTDIKFAGEPFYNSGVTDPFAVAARKEISGIELCSNFYTADDIKVVIPNSTSEKQGIFRKQKNVTYADEYYFKLFPFYKWIAGNTQDPLKAPYQTVITESRARTYFPGLDPKAVIGKQIIYDDSLKTSVSAVIRDPEEITDFTFREFISMATMDANHMHNEEWGSVTSSNQFFVKLAPNQSIAKLNSELSALLKKNNKNEQTSSTNYMIEQLQPLSDIHFNDHYDNFGQRLAQKNTLWGLSLVAGFLLLLGCINFINLTTAQASQRAKEIGVRKTMGSTQKQLVFQFLSETLFTTLIAAFVSAIITPWLLQIFSDFIPAGLHFDLLNQPQLILFMIALVLVVTLLSGFYPAMILSGFRPVLVLKNQAFGGTAKTRRTWIRKTLTVSQFVIAQFLIMATLAVTKQIHFTLSKDLGFKKDAIITMRIPWNNRKPDPNRDVLLNEINKMPEVQLASLAEPPASTNTSSRTIKYKDGKKEIETDVQLKYGDTNYLSLYRLKLLAGRNIQESDSEREYIINETYAKILGFNNPEDAIGKMVGEDKKIPIVGVVSNFHQSSLHTPIKPLAICSAKNNTYSISVALKSSNGDSKNWQNAFAKMGVVYKRLYPEEDFKYDFFDESIAKFYKSEQDISRLLKWATGLAIFISCLGLLGLVIYTTNLRMKEISVRKVLGASVRNLITLLSTDFIRLVIISFFVATPIAWWSMNKWLQNYAYRTELSWWLFPLSGFIIILIALLTLSIQTFRAAVANPTKALRSE
ncbi:MAG: cell division protein FtsX [Bacteroidetes bacterium]|nr:MAG: cell division protein FtsX [Bacteroidota bacterium]